MKIAMFSYLSVFFVVNRLELSLGACTSGTAPCYTEKNAILPRPGPGQYDGFCMAIMFYAMCVFQESCTVTYGMQSQILSEITTMISKANVQCTVSPSEIVQCSSGLAQCIHQLNKNIEAHGDDLPVICRDFQNYINCMSQQSSCHITLDVLSTEVERVNAALTENEAGCSVSTSGTLITPAPTPRVTPAPTVMVTQSPTAIVAQSPTAIVDCSSVISGCFQQLQSKPYRGRDVYATCRDAQDYINCMTQQSSCPIASDLLDDQVDKMNTFLSQNRAGCSVSTSGTLTITRNGAAFISPSFTKLTILATMLYVVSQYFLHR